MGWGEPHHPKRITHPVDPMPVAPHAPTEIPQAAISTGSPEFRETFTYRGRFMGELVIPGELLDDPRDCVAVTTEMSHWHYVRFRMWEWWHLYVTRRMK